MTTWTTTKRYKSAIHAFEGMQARILRGDFILEMPALSV